MHDPESPARRRKPDRVGDLLPDAARALGLEDELRLARAISTWDALVAERVPPAVGACRLVALERDAIVVEVDEPIVAAELRMRALELLGAFAHGPRRRPRARAASPRRYWTDDAPQPLSGGTVGSAAGDAEWPETAPTRGFGCHRGWGGSPMGRIGCRCV